MTTGIGQHMPEDGEAHLDVTMTQAQSGASKVHGFGGATVD